MTDMRLRIKRVHVASESRGMLKNREQLRTCEMRSCFHKFQRRRMAERIMAPGHLDGAEEGTEHLLCLQNLFGIYQVV